MISTLAAAVIAVWFYFTAQKTGRDAISWAVVGLVIYLTVAFSWTWFITPSLKDMAIHSRNGLMVFIARYAFIVVGVSCAVVYNLKFAGKKQQD